MTIIASAYQTSRGFKALVLYRNVRLEDGTFAPNRNCIPTMRYFPTYDAALTFALDWIEKHDGVNRSVISVR